MIKGLTVGLSVTQQSSASDEVKGKMYSATERGGQFSCQERSERVRARKNCTKELASARVVD